VPLRGFTAAGELVCGLYAPPVCGNGLREAGEDFEPAPGPFSTAPVNATTCTFDFSAAPQLYCNGSCSINGSGCDQDDADLFCRLKTGNPNAVAAAFSVETALPLPGFSCPLPMFATYGTKLTHLGSRGVSVPVFYSEDSILDTHGEGMAITSVTCTTP
jgi:hypothetical protein